MNWNTVPLYAIAKQKKIVNCIGRELLSVYLGIGVIPFSKKSEKRTNVTSADLSKYQAVDYGDFVLNNQQAWRGSVGVSKYSGIVSPAYIVLEMNDALQTPYANYLFQSRSMVDQYVVCSKGVGSIQRNIYWDYLKRITVPIPSYDEQDQIVRFLDWKVSQINKLINAKRRQIVLLQEYKQVVINEAVTRGSAEWTETRLINLLENIKAGAWGENASESDINLPCIRVADFDYSRLRIRDAGYTVRSYQQGVAEKLMLKKHDILIEKSGGGDKQTVGRAVLFDKSFPALCANFIEVARLKNTAHSAFLVYLLASMYYHEIQRFHFNQTTGIQNLNVKGYLRESVYIPPLLQQQAIVIKLDKQCTNIDVIITKLTDEITLLAEYCTRLISDVVTGKLDVCGVVVPEYEAVENTIDTEDELFDEEEFIEINEA